MNQRRALTLLVQSPEGQLSEMIRRPNHRRRRHGLGHWEHDSREINHRQINDVADGRRSFTRNSRADEKPERAKRKRSQDVHASQSKALTYAQVQVSQG